MDRPACGTMGKKSRLRRPSFPIVFGEADPPAHPDCQRFTKDVIGSGAGQHRRSRRTSIAMRAGSVRSYVIAVPLSERATTCALLCPHQFDGSLRTSASILWRLRARTHWKREVLRLRPCFPAPLRMTGYFGARAMSEAATRARMSFAACCTIRTHSPHGLASAAPEIRSKLRDDPVAESSGLFLVTQHGKDCRARA